jgi:2-phosphosulfolactate phosphatase
LILIKPTIEVCLSPALLHTYNLQNKIAVVIDVLRATSTICTALHNGASKIIPVASIDECMAYSIHSDYLLAAERDAKLPDGFVYGNSPKQYNTDKIKNKTIVLTTTNGTKMLHLCLGAEQIVIGSFGNMDALANYLLQQNKPVIMACSAWKDKVNMEDSIMAGGIVHRLKNNFTMACDSARMMEQQYAIAKNNIYEAHRIANHFGRLLDLGAADDLKFCLTENNTPVVPVLQGDSIVNVV